MSRKLLVFLGLGAGIILLPLAAQMLRGESGKEVETVPVESQSIRSAVLASGQLAYREQVQLRSVVIGKALAVPVEEGDRVSSGDLVIALDPEQYRAQLEQQQANVRMQEIAIERQQVLMQNLERQMRRTREMYERQLLDASTFEAAENELALARVDLRSREESLSQARAALAQAEDNLAKTRILSPIDGIIIKLDVKPGEAVIAGTTNIPGSTLAVVADTSVMLAEVRVDEADIAMIAHRQHASIYAAAFPDTPLPGLVETISTSAQRAEGQQNLSFEVKVRLTEPDRVSVRPGMSCRAEIYTETSDDALAVPLQAVMYDDNAEGDVERPYVFIIEDGRAKRRDVSLGLSSDSHMEVTDGLEAGERIISGPFRTLRHLQDGEAVKVVERAGEDRSGD